MRKLSAMPGISTRPIWAQAALAIALSCAATGCGRSEIFRDGRTADVDAGLPDGSFVPDGGIDGGFDGGGGCRLQISPASMDFGTVPVGASATKTVTVGNVGTASCDVSKIVIDSASDPAFSLSAGQSASLTLAPGDVASVSVDFGPESDQPPLHKTGSMTLFTTDASQPKLTVALAANVDSGCSLKFAPLAIDFGTVPLHTSQVRALDLANVGTGICDVSSVGFGPGSDPLFRLATGQATHLTIAPSASAQVSVAFDASSGAPPLAHSSALVLTTNDPKLPVASVLLSATIQLGCLIDIQPPSLDFGTVTFNLSASGKVTVTNVGDTVCAISQVAMGTGSDPLFALLPGQPTSLSVAPGGSATISVVFVGTAAEAPHARSATVTFASTDTGDPPAVIPISATVNTACVDDSSWIFTLDSDTTLSKFDPVQLTFQDIGKVNCNDFSGPNSMAVDMNGLAWAGYHSGNIYWIDTATAACQATGFLIGQHGLVQFGMEFLFDPPTATESLYVAGGLSLSSTASTLATIDTATLVLTPVGPISVGFIEPGATPDGEFWGFAPTSTSANGAPTLARIDPTNAKTLSTKQYSAITTNGAFAMKFFQGGFWIFDGTSVYRVDHATGDLTTELTKMAHPDGTPREILGAGFSMCPPAP